MGELCPICGGAVYPWDRTLKEIYNKHSLGRLCDSCGNKADSFVDYYGKKKDLDIKNLYSFISNGIEPQRQLHAIMNAGYWKII